MSFVKLHTYPEIEEIKAVYVNMANVTYMERWDHCTALFFNDEGTQQLNVVELAETILGMMDDEKVIRDIRKGKGLKPIERPQPLR